jgi:dihydrofolate reductase
MNGKVVVNRCMSLDGFIAGPGHSMDWGGGRALADFMAPDDFAEVAAATGAMLVGRRTWEVGDRMEAEEPGSTDYPFSGPMFLLTHRPLEPPNPVVTILSGDIGEAVATALDAAGGKNLEILGADVASQCLQQGSSTRSWCMCCRCCSATASASRPRALRGQTWNRSAACGRATRPSSASASASSPTRPTDRAGSPVPGWRQVSVWMRHCSTLWSSQVAAIRAVARGVCPPPERAHAGCADVARVACVGTRRGAWMQA